MRQGTINSLKTQKVTNTACDSLYYFLANHTAKVVTDVILQSFTGKDKTELCKNFCKKCYLGTYSACKI